MTGAAAAGRHAARPMPDRRRTGHARHADPMRHRGPDFADVLTVLVALVGAAFLTAVLAVAVAPLVLGAGHAVARPGQRASSVL
jgi:hypothetical protein